jgi:DNA-binding transcriptional ArsR family regulator
VETRDLTGDAGALGALAHPVRLALLERLGRDGALTASEAGRLLGESAGTMSWHLSVLARHGFVVESGGSGRRRPWKLAAQGQRWDAEAADPEERAAGNALARLVLHRHVRRVEAWLEERQDVSAEWRDAADLHSFTLHLTAAEAAEVTAQVTEVLEAYQHRLGHPEERPEGTVPVHLLVAMTPELS